MLPSGGNPESAKVAAERMSEFLNLMDRFETLTWRDIYNIVTVGVWEVKEKDRLFAMLIKAGREGRRPQDIENLESALRIAVSASFHIAERIGGFAGIGSMVFNPTKTFDDWQIYNPKLLIRNFSEGSFGRMSGILGKGKTNGACVIMEEWHNSGNLCVSNIAKKKSTPIYTFSNTARSLLETIAGFKRKQPWIFVYDEGGASGYSNKDAMTLKAKYLEQFFRVIRHLYGNVLYVDQRQMSAPAVILELSTSHFHAVEIGVLHLELSSPFKFSRTVNNFPKTSIPYDDHNPAIFEMNVNITKLLMAMSGEQNPYQAMLDFLETKEAEPPKGRIT
jgi:hypothetical protein